MKKLLLSVALSVSMAVIPVFADIGTFAKKVTFTVDYDGPSGVVDIPVLVRLAANSPEGFAYADCAAGGSDLCFADANGAVLPYEIDTWNTAGESLVWVKAPAVTQGTTFTMYYSGTPAAANTPSATWSGYTGVWHFNELGADATANSKGVFANSTSVTGIDAHLSAVSTAGEAGKFGSSFRPNDATDYNQGNYNDGGAWVVDSGSDSPLDATNGMLTVSVWIRHQDWSRYNNDKIFYKRLNSDNSGDPSGAFLLESASTTDNNGRLLARTSSDGRSRDENYEGPDPRKDWVYVTVAYGMNKTRCTLYENGVLIKDNMLVALVNNDAPLTFGNTITVAESAAGAGSYAWNGWIDEARYIRDAKSADWIAAEYAAMAEASFLSAGEVEDIGPTVPKYEVSWSGAANATVVAEVNGDEIGSGTKIGDGTNVVFTVTPDTDYEFAAAPYGGWTLTEGVLTRTVTVNGEAVSIVIPDATAKVVPPPPPPVDGRYESYPETVPEGKVVTYDADSAGDPETLEPGRPYCVVDAADYPFVYTTQERTSALHQTLAFRSAEEFRYNASARIGDTYYLFLGEAVEKATTGDTIELLRNNYAIKETMLIKYKAITIHGNGYAVKVAYPFMDETGFVNTNCTDTVKNVFEINNGGDVLIDHMTIMGGGEHLTDDDPGSNTAATPAVVTKIAANSGILRMDHVTITRSQGGLYVQGGEYEHVMTQSKVYLSACNIVRNARYCGGGLYNKGFLVMVGSSLSENRSLDDAGGGAACENQGTMFMNNCVVCNNGSTQWGGAINQLNNTTYPELTRLYLMNTTISGNFSSYKNDAGGGVGIHGNSDEIKLYAVNSLICNNYYFDTTTLTLTESDIREDDVNAGENCFYSCVYGVISNGDPTLVDCVRVEDPSAETVFKGYSSFRRVYEHNLRTEPINGATLENGENDPMVRYAPLCSGSEADFGTAGVYTYFDASGWRDGSVRMSYKSEGGEMTALGACQAADEDDLVTTYYETEFIPNVTDRELGVVGASGFGTLKTMYTLTLQYRPENGKVSRNLSVNGTSYAEGTEVTVTATPDATCSFLGWYYEDDDKTVHRLSASSSYTFTMDGDKQMYALFTPPSPTHVFNVDCEQATDGTHGKFPITITTNWIGRVFGDICPGGIVPDEKVSEVEGLLNAPDTVNGLNHVWQNFVLGAMEPGDPAGRIWIRGEQTLDSSTLRFRLQEFVQTQGCGFDVKYRIAAATAESEFDRTGAYANSGSFEDAVESDTLKYRVIDMIFIPTGYETSCEYVTTVNTAGVLKVASSKKVEILGAPWSGFSPTNNPAVKATDYAKASCLSEGDVLYVYDRENQNYLAWTVQNDGTWAAVKTFTLANGVVTESVADATWTNDIPRGAGVWLERKDTTNPILLYGQVDPSPVRTSLESGFNLVANPYPNAFAATSLAAPATAGEDGDRVVIPTGDAPINAYYRDGAWKTPHNREVTITNPVTGGEMTGYKTEWSSDGLTLPVGLGFWYFNAGSEPVELTWPVVE